MVSFVCFVFVGNWHKQLKKKKEHHLWEYITWDSLLETYSQRHLSQDNCQQFPSTRGLRPALQCDSKQDRDTEVAFSELSYSTLVSQSSSFPDTEVFWPWKNKSPSSTFSGNHVKGGHAQHGFLGSDQAPLCGSQGRRRGGLTWDPTGEMWIPQRMALLSPLESLSRFQLILKLSALMKSQRLFKWKDHFILGCMSQAQLLDMAPAMQNHDIGA